MTRRLFFYLAVAVCSAAAQQLTFTPFDPSGIYDLGAKAGWRVTAAGVAGTPLKVEYVLRRNNADEVKRGLVDLTTGIGTIEASTTEPAMIYAEVTGAGDKPVHLGLAVAPSKLAPATPRPDDFDSFWDAKLKTLARIPINPSLTPVPDMVEGVDLYTVKLDSVRSHVQGYLAKPSRDGKFPALVIYQYAGVYALNARTVTDRAAEGWLAFDVDSHDMLPTEATAPRNYQAVGNTDREASYFLNMYLRDARAIDYIASRPDWDGKTIVIMGTSMGGQQSLVTAALRADLVTAVLVNEPSGADSNGDLHGRKAGYPNWPSRDAAVMKTALYFDTVNFAPRIKAPALVALGFIDTTAPPAGIWTAFNQISGPKELIPMIESDHNNRTPEKQGAWNARSKEVLGILLNGGTFVPQASK
ncbi:MAG TPA: acetylxylan esterase [Candidatus Limnocylindrales bacterium]|nr:acetylxylan esterase [Candidatus Limnocylindrales bacterium]